MFGNRIFQAIACLAGCFAACFGLGKCAPSEGLCDVCGLAIQLEVQPDSASDRYTLAANPSPAFLSLDSLTPDSSGSNTVFRINGGPGEYTLRIVRNGTDTLPALQAMVRETKGDGCRTNNTVTLQVRIERDSAGTRRPIILSSVAKPRC
jgi:hypothetical protein